MGIAEFLDAPDGAVLVAINGEVELVTTRHETPMRLTIERFPLGPVASVDAIMALLDLHAVLPAERHTSQQAALPGPSDIFICPECEHTFSRKDNLRNHRSRVHHVARGDTACPDCGQLVVSIHALAVHRARKHPTRARSEVPAPAAAPSPPGPPVVAAMPADPRGLCDTCGMPNRNHLACEECGRRIGKGHTVDAPAKQRGGKVWCADCLETLRLQARYDGKAA